MTPSTGLRRATLLGLWAVVYSLTLLVGALLATALIFALTV